MRDARAVRQGGHVRPLLTARQPSGQQRVVGVPGDQGDAERGQHGADHAVGGQVDDEDQQPGEGEDVHQDVERQAEEGVQVAAGPPGDAEVGGRFGGLGTRCGGGHDQDSCRGQAATAARGRSVEQGGRVGDPAEDAALGGDHVEADALELREVGADAVGEDQDVVAPVIGFADRRVHAHLGGHPGDDERLDARVGEDLLQIGAVEGALAGLVEHDLPGQRCKLVDDVVAVLAAHQDAAVRPGVADPQRRLAASQLGRGQVGEVRQVPLAGVDDQQSRLTGGGQDALQRRDDRRQLADIVAEGLTEPAGQQEVALHVDQQQGDLARWEAERLGVSGDGDVLGHAAAPRAGNESEVGDGVSRWRRCGPRRPAPCRRSGRVRGPSGWPGGRRR